MDDHNLSKFGTVDYCVFAGMLIASGTIGLCTSLIGIKSPEEFLMGNRSFKPLPVAMSLLTSLVSSIGILGIALAIVFCSQFALPVLHPLKLTSITEVSSILGGLPLRSNYRPHHRHKA
ncbi:Sodium-coupled monocarboxylate transporter 1 [Armadillidium nasatum]|uniref:Sodium-coupled monocarboxylate transporter 1 n=1 Tax=Armadillidium nasatum TaxID=96803 RepID=A0A5N5SMV1_9CRUS|nr:Sodium-coupled monocarboxylate transporter 1 [Armadillidium nasatum]